MQHLNVLAISCPPQQTAQMGVQLFLHEDMIFLHNANLFSHLMCDLGDCELQIYRVPHNEQSCNVNVPDVTSIAAFWPCCTQTMARGQGFIKRNRIMEKRSSK